MAEPATELNSLKRVSIVQQVEQVIADRIVDGTYAVDTKLPAEMTLSKQLGVGRGTVREAFRLLEAKGLVEIRPGRGAFVASDKEAGAEQTVQWFRANEMELLDCVQVRNALEPLAARLMAERSQPEDLLELQHIHQKFVEAVEKQDAATIAKYDEKFHTSIVKASRNQLLIKINHQTCERIKNFRQRTFQHNQNALNAIMPHAKILAALQAGDADAARALYAQPSGVGGTGSDQHDQGRKRLLIRGKKAQPVKSIRRHPQGAAPLLWKAGGSGCGCFFAKL